MNKTKISKRIYHIQTGSKIFFYIKIKLRIPRIINGSYLCSHSSKLFKGNKILRQIVNDFFNSSVRYCTSYYEKLKIIVNNCLNLHPA